MEPKTIKETIVVIKRGKNDIAEKAVFTGPRQFSSAMSYMRTIVDGSPDIQWVSKLEQERTI